MAKHDSPNNQCSCVSCRMERVLEPTGNDPDTIESVMRELLSATRKKISLELDPVFGDFYVYLHDMDCINDCVCAPFIEAVKTPLDALQQARYKLMKASE